MYTISDIIRALGRHSDEAAIEVLESVGTNSSNNEVRIMTAKALIERNTHNSLKILLINRGKGIHDFDKDVSSNVIDLLKAQIDKTEIMKILDDTINFHSDGEVRAKSKQVKEILASTMFSTSSNSKFEFSLK